MRRFYVVIQEKEKDGKGIKAYVLKVTSVDNLISKLNKERIMTANIMNTKKEAEELVKFWNNL